MTTAQQAREHLLVRIAREGLPEASADRFWDRVEWPVFGHQPWERDVDACWPWLNPTCKGYGVLSVEGVVLYAHRIAYAQATGDAAVGLHVCHRCDAPACCNPEHLFSGSIDDNMADCRLKRRHAHGETHPRRKLVAAQVREMRDLRSAGWPVRALADRYDVGTGLVSLITRRLLWKHVP